MYFKTALMKVSQSFTPQAFCPTSRQVFPTLLSCINSTALAIRTLTLLPNSFSTNINLGNKCFVSKTSSNETSLGSFLMPTTASLCRSISRNHSTQSGDVTASKKAILFPATYKKIACLPGFFPREMLEKESGLFGASMDFALERGGEITKRFLLAFLKIPYVMQVYKGEVSGYQILIDTKMHNLQKGEIPSTPGWHTDFAENGSFGEPDYSKVNPKVTTFIVNFSDHPEGVSNTEYVVEPVSLILPMKRVYDSMDRQLRNNLQLKTAQLEDGEIFEMDQLALHRGVPAHNDGMRGFIRLSILHEFPFMINASVGDSKRAKDDLSGMVNKHHNKVRTHMQAYVRAGPEVISDGYLHIKGNVKKQLPPLELVLKKHLYERKQFSCGKELLNMPRVLTEDEIKREPIIINASLDYAWNHGGSITQSFLQNLQQHPLVQKAVYEGNAHKIKINTRIHMLNVGQFPDIPVWRSGAPFSKQINSDSNEEYILIYLSNKMGGVSVVEFDAGNGVKFDLSDGECIHFASGLRHRAKPAFESGWRFTFMLSIDDIAVENKIVKQTRVYLDEKSTQCSCTVSELQVLKKV